MVPYINLVIELGLPGQAQDGSTVRFIRMKCGNTLAQVVAAGYLNPWLHSQGGSVYDSDFFFVAASDGNQIYKPVIGADGVVTLTVLP
ncbi:MAG TPA: hypothetical protein VK622_10700 [Puia sp.]|nr:hypothetical protein [Puia sp.]